MNSRLPPTGSSARLAGQLHTRRCVRHESREAAARCLACGRDFCRECVVDHDGRLLCAGCLAKLGAAAGERKRDWKTTRRAVALAAAALAGWLAFFGVGKLLMRIPAEVHEGTIWKAAAEGTP